jgi:hypothetical protein
MAPALLAALLQGSAWIASPARPTVGDTIWLARSVPAAPGWRVRAGTLPSSPAGEPLGDPVVVPADSGWAVRYPMVAWVAGPMMVSMPPLWRLGPDGTADSLPGGTAVFRVFSVIPDSVATPAPQPALAPLRLARHAPLLPLAALLVSVGLLVALVAWRRRAPRAGALGPDLVLDKAVPDERWLAAGEPKAVAARAAHALRVTIARMVPAAHEGLSTLECLAVVEQARPGAPVRELRDLLAALDRVAFATAHGADVVPLAERARALGEDLAP